MMARLVSVLAVLLALALVAAPAAADPATVTIDAPSSAGAGETVTVTLNVTNTGANATGYLLNVSLPDGWTVATHTDDGARWQANDTEWVWLSIDPGASRHPSLELTVPSDPADETAEFTASVADSERVRDTAVADVTVESSDGGGDDGSGDSGSDDGSGDSGSGTDGSDGGSDDGSGDSGSDSDGSDSGSDDGPDSTDTGGSDEFITGVSNESTTDSNSTSADGGSADESTAGTSAVTDTRAGATLGPTETAEPAGTSASSDSDGQFRTETSTESGTRVGNSSPGPAIPGGLTVGALLLLAIGVGLVTVRQRDLTVVSSTPAEGDGSAAAESPAHGDTDSGTAAAEQPADTTAGDDRSAISTAFETSGVDVIDVRMTGNGCAVEYWTETTDEGSVDEEVRALTESYLTAIDEGVEPRRLDVTLVRNAEPLATWHIREPWIHQLADRDMSPEAFEQLVLRTVTRMD